MNDSALLAQFILSSVLTATYQTHSSLPNAVANGFVPSPIIYQAIKFIYSTCFLRERDNHFDPYTAVVRLFGYQVRAVIRKNRDSETVPLRKFLSQNRNHGRTGPVPVRKSSF